MINILSNGDRSIEKIQEVRINERRNSFNIVSELEDT